MLQLRDHGRRDLRPLFFQNQLGFLGRQMAEQFAIAMNPRRRGQINQLGGPERLGDRHRHGIRVQPISMAFPIAAQRRNDRNDVMFEQGMQQDRVDSLDPSCPLMIDALEDAGWVGHQRVSIGATKIGRR